MKEIKTPLQRHMDNTGNQLKKESKGNINSRKEFQVELKVDTSELDCAIKKLKKFNKLVKKSKLPRVIFSTHGNLDEKEIINLLDKYQWK